MSICQRQPGEAAPTCGCSTDHACSVAGCDDGRIILCCSIWTCDICGKEYGEDWTDGKGCVWSSMYCPYCGKKLDGAVCDGCVC